MKMSPEEYAEKMLSFDDKEKVLMFVTDNYYTELSSEDGEENEQSKFVKEAIKSSTELLKVKEQVSEYFNEYDAENEDEDYKETYFSKFDVSEDETNLYAQALKLDWFEIED
jgi:hypothetical protein